jgi:hypothetical protein
VTELCGARFGWLQESEVEMVPPSRLKPESGKECSRCRCKPCAAQHRAERWTAAKDKFAALRPARLEAEQQWIVSFRVQCSSTRLRKPLATIFLSDSFRFVISYWEGSLFPSSVRYVPAVSDSLPDLISLIKSFQRNVRRVEHHSETQQRAYTGMGGKFCRRISCSLPATSQ